MSILGALLVSSLYFFAKNGQARDFEQDHWPRIWSSIREVRYSNRTSGFSLNSLKRGYAIVLSLIISGLIYTAALMSDLAGLMLT